MRPDVKLGVVISLVVVLVAGGYYLYRDSREVPIPVSENALTAAKPPNEAVRPRTPGPAGAIRSTTSQARRAEGPRKRSTSRNDVGRPEASTPEKSSRIVDRRGKLPSGSGRTAEPSVSGGGSQSRVRPGPKRAEGTLKQSTGQGAADADSSTGNPARGGLEEKVADAGPVPSGSAAAPHAAGRRGSARQVTKPASEMQRASGQQPATPDGSQIASGTPDLSARKLEGRRRPEAVETHRVQPGDTLASLARSYYGHERYTSFLVEHNSQISDPNRLRVGMSVRIPPAPSDHGFSTGATQPPRAASPRKDSAKPRTYTAVPGDSFYGIARTVLGDAGRWEELFALNKDRVHGDPKRLQVGQVLILPD